MIFGGDRDDLPDGLRQIASLPQAVVLLRPGLKIASVNAAAEQMLGQGARRLIGKALGAVVEFGEPRILTMMADSEVQISARDIAVKLGKADAARVNLAIAPVIGNAGWQIMTMTVPTELEGLEEISPEASENMVLRAPEILAHEIKNPLAGIRGAAQLLSRKLKAKDRALAELIADEVDRIAGLIDQMQSLSRKTREPGGVVNLHVAVRKARAVVEASGLDGVVLTEEFDPSLPDIRASNEMLMQVLINLMTNAIEASRSNEAPAVRLRTRFASGIALLDRARGLSVPLPIEITVADNGPGIDPAVRDHLFEPFVTSKKHGQGLGLALVRKLVRDMDGRISHDRDERGGWTNFRIHLPVAQTADEPKPKIEEILT
ncbi:two-component system sensor histidine kinase NtrB [Croceicoccus naphthovorans]|uniref:histidine kinase n=1 Tax=Croceicoccus naphthovorans TaxID=1348774 RepID=A0A0G3XEW7_9SPHN|nr:ATP-binding protein [Croceicoccus naphthovorans]AKM10055.1 histidine kinase [Croceicoccus naphthovorans]MBB3991230.1 two-component system nitrogen regulation sensor histidine kinase GlnL [Croceicoccus naphthovorans]